MRKVPTKVYTIGFTKHGGNISVGFTQKVKVRRYGKLEYSRRASEPSRQRKSSLMIPSRISMSLMNRLCANGFQISKLPILPHRRSQRPQDKAWILGRVSEVFRGLKIAQSASWRDDVLALPRKRQIIDHKTHRKPTLRKTSVFGQPTKLNSRPGASHGAERPVRGVLF
jgi:hypothetical protein